MPERFLSVFTDFREEYVKALLETLDMMGTALVISLFAGLLLGFVLFITGASGIRRNRLVYSLLSGAINLVRSVPFILLIIVMIPFNRQIVGTGFGVTASKVPLSIIGMALYARFTEQNLLDVDKSTYETSYTMGADLYQYFRYFLLREARSGLILSFTTMAISLLSYSTVMGIIGGGGLGYLAISEGYQNFNYDLMWIIILTMVILVQLLQAAGNLLAKKYDKR